MDSFDAQGKTKRGCPFMEQPLMLMQQELLLSALVSLVELIDTTCSIHKLNLTGVEWM